MNRLGFALLAIIFAVPASGAEHKPTQVDAGRCLSVSPLPEENYTTREPYCVTRGVTGNGCFDSLIGVEVKNTCAMEFTVEATKGAKIQRYYIAKGATQKITCLRLETPCSTITVQAVFRPEEPKPAETQPVATATAPPAVAPPPGGKFGGALSKAKEKGAGADATYDAMHEEMHSNVETAAEISKREAAEYARKLAAQRALEASPPQGPQGWEPNNASNILLAPASCRQHRYWSETIEMYGINSPEAMYNCQQLLTDLKNKGLPRCKCD